MSDAQHDVGYVRFGITEKSWDFSEHDDDGDESGRRGKDKQINIIIGTWSYEHVVSDRKKRGRGID